MEIVELANNLKEHVIKKHQNAAIIAIYGSTAIGENNEFSDLDMFAILDDEKNKVDISFIYNDQTIDLLNFCCV